ncbi:MAG: HPr family phosphocarrier protein [Chlamydiota bacterium]|nr:HPr family phosphocarrier protein [Chlamydiota bacterium]
MGSPSSSSFCRLKKKTGKCSGQFLVKNQRGLHTRPATDIVRLLKGHCAKVTFSHGGRLADAHSILSLLTLEAEAGALIDFTVEGEEPEEVKKKLCEAANTYFGSQY